MHNWSKGWALRGLNIGVSIKEETIFTGANYYPFLTLMIAKSKRKKEKEKYYRCLFFLFFFFWGGLKYATVICRYIRSSWVLTTKSKEQRTKEQQRHLIKNEKILSPNFNIPHFSPFLFFIFFLPFGGRVFGGSNCIQYLF